MAGFGTALIIVAHPDDETIGAAEFVCRSPRQCRFIHVTDGAPRERRLWTTLSGTPRPNSREAYAQIRRRELTRALDLAGVEASQRCRLRVTDLEAVGRLDFVARRLADTIAALRPTLVVTHDYAGGHPDHDASALAVWLANHLLGARGIEPAPIYEMPLYHGAGGRFHVGAFLPRRAPECGQLEKLEQLELTLSAAQHRRKRAMLDAFESQRETLRRFYQGRTERFRRAPSYDFTQPPHSGPLLYERWNLPLTGQRWRRLAAQAIARFAQSGPAELRS